MSYILEALKKAQAERAHGAVPGVDAQPVPTIAARSPVPMGAWIIIVLVLLVSVAILYWQEPWSRPGRDASSIAAQAPEAAVAPEAADARAPSAASSAAPGADVHGNAVSKPAPTLAPAPAPASASAPASAPTPARPLRKLGERAAGEPAAPAPAPTPAPERIALLQELPPQIQREIPTLAINGYIYASNPADRSVLINNRLRREGDTLAEGFVLEKLLPREMVLNYRGYRYRISY
jgi:general secretion pathway protein B